MGNTQAMSEWGIPSSDGEYPSEDLHALQRKKARMRFMQCSKPHTPEEEEMKANSSPGKGGADSFLFKSARRGGKEPISPTLSTCEGGSTLRPVGNQVSFDANVTSRE